MTALVDTSNRWSRIAIALVSTSLVYNVIEAVIALWSGAVADSIALLGFGLESGIETAAATVMLYRLWAEYRGVDGERLARIEHRVHQFVGAARSLSLSIAAGRRGMTTFLLGPSAERPRSSPRLLAGAWATAGRESGRAAATFLGRRPQRSARHRSCRSSGP